MRIPPFPAAAAGLATVMLCSPTPLRAHHSFATEFNAKKQIHLIGTVSRVDWTNPHAVIYLNVKTPDGKVAGWTVQAGAPNALIGRGLAKDALKVGTEIEVDGYRAKDDSNYANGRDITLPDGRRLFLGASASGAPYDEKRADKYEK